MKKFTLFIFFIWQLNGLQAQTWVYHPFPTDSTTWTIVEYGYGTMPTETGTWHFALDGDTLISGLAYSKIYVNSGSLGTINPESGFNRYTASYYGAIREDSSKKIWFRWGSSAVDRLYYDFALTSGDTFCFENQPSGVTCLPVSDVDSILINGNYRRQIHFEYGGQSETWIEGIGSTVDNFFGVWSFIGNVEFTLNCFHQNKVNLYGACDYPTGIDIIANKQNVYKLFPNPSNGKFQLSLSNIKESTIEVSDVLGNTILKAAIKAETTELDLSAYKSGIYFVRMYDSEGNFVVKKIVKQ